jgi:hypothetical protein
VNLDEGNGIAPAGPPPDEPFQGLAWAFALGGRIGVMIIAPSAANTASK